MKMLELFAGTGIMGDTFAEHGFEVTKVDLNEKFEDCVHADAYQYLRKHAREYDVIWAAPDCATYSYATYAHRLGHGDHSPKSDYARYCDRMNHELFNTLESLTLLGVAVFIENPVGHMQYMPWTNRTLMTRYRTAFCPYGG